MRGSYRIRLHKLANPYISKWLSDNSSWTPLCGTVPEEPLAAIMPRICVDKRVPNYGEKKSEWITNALFGSVATGCAMSGSVAAFSNDETSNQILCQIGTARY